MPWLQALAYRILIQRVFFKRNEIQSLTICCRFFERLNGCQKVQPRTETCFNNREMILALPVDQRDANLLDGSTPFYRCYRCRDGGEVAVGALEPRFYAALLAEPTPLPLTRLQRLVTAAPPPLRPEDRRYRLPQISLPLPLMRNAPTRSL